MKTATLKPGFLVSLKTSVKGGVNYTRSELESAHTTESGELVARWETRKAIQDPAEFERATVARNRARSIIGSVCFTSSFGYLCPLEREQQLADAITEARAVADAHNDTAEQTRVEVYIMAGRVAQDDAEAARAIASEVRELMQAMEAGIANAEPAKIRDAANRARELGGMLTDSAAKTVNAAIEQARSAAREIVKRVEKSGERAAVVVAQLNADKIKAARFAFLDMDDAKPVTTEAPAARGLDIEPDAAPVSAAPPARWMGQPALQLEF